MATSAVARETVFALRRQIAKIEGTLPERLEAPMGADSAPAVVLRRSGGVPVDGDLLPTGVAPLDAALGGGLQRAALTEIHGRETRDAGSVAGFTLALVSLLLKEAPMKSPVLWIGTAEIFRETGLPYARGLDGHFGIGPDHLLMAQAPKLADALWIAEEAARLTALSAVLLEMRGNSQRLDLTATRRLHRRAQEAGRPVFLLRQSAEAEATAAPLRFLVEPATAGMRCILGRPLAGSIGPPAFAVTLDKNRLAPPARFILEWNADDRTFRQREADGHGRQQDPVALVPLPQHRPDMAAAAGSRLAYGRFRFPAAAGQPS
jgi:protein ImuA